MDGAHEVRSGAVLYAKNVDRVSAFYRDVVGLRVSSVEPDHAALVGAGFEVVVVAIPEPLAATIEVTTPPVRREDVAVKLMFVVADLEAARQAATRHGGEVYPREREWRYGDWTVCDGYDCEGNVIQLRVR